MFCCLRNRRPDLGNLAAGLVVQTKVLKGCRIDDCGETRSGGYGIPTPGKRGSGARPRNSFLYMDTKYWF